MSHGTAAKPKIITICEMEDPRKWWISQQELQNICKRRRKAPNREHTTHDNYLAKQLTRRRIVDRGNLPHSPPIAIPRSPCMPIVGQCMASVNGEGGGGVSQVIIQ